MPTRIACHDKFFCDFISVQQIATRISELAQDLQQRYATAASSKPPLFVGILNGATIFHADLIRACNFDLHVAYLRTKSYSGMNSTGKVEITWPMDVDFAGRHVCIVEDIVDSGLTLATLAKEFYRLEVSSLTTVVLLDKKTARTTPFTPDFAGFTIADKFVIGYGLDYNGLGRNLPAIYQLDGV